MTARIVAALQAPTLLNNLAQCPGLRLEVVDITSAKDAFREATLLRCPAYDGNPTGNPGGVRQFWGCAGHHFAWANAHLPGVPQIMLAHSGLPENVGPCASHRLTVAFSRANVRAMRDAFNPPGLHRLSPAYTPEPVWSWAPGMAWTMFSRPSQRQGDMVPAFARLLAALDVRASTTGTRWTHRLYGEGQRLGFLAGPERDALTRACSLYLTFQQPWGGFGLAEHECMAAGVPVVGLRWGDFADEAPDHPGLHDSVEAVVDAAHRCLVDEAFARQVSEAGLDYVRRCRTLAALELTVHGLLHR